jgi:two-component system response regulator FlrC
MRLIIVGPLEGHLTHASQIAIERGVLVTHVSNLEQLFQMLRSGKGADLLMADVTLDIKKLVQQLKDERFYLPVVACGLGTDAKQAAAAIRSGAKEYIPLPPDSELIAAVIGAVAQDHDPVLSVDPKMTEILKIAEQVAKSDASILITGESGSGKEVIAKWIHEKSHRKNQGFISVNCAAIPEHLLESELFGHEKGAFTGAVAQRIGKFEEANGGTLLLDEISEMHPLLQAKLLRAIQEREIDRVGGHRPIKVNIRILATSNRNLKEEVKAQRFREDLYFRLNVVPLHLPPLRQRKKDLELLSQYFIEKYSQSNGIPLRPLSKEAKSALESYDWPGNIRELENTIHRAVLLTSGEYISLESLMLQQKSSSQTQSNDRSQDILWVGRTVDEVERDLILDTLNYYYGNRTHAAHVLGISIRTLRNKLKQYGTEENPSNTDQPQFKKIAY